MHSPRVLWIWIYILSLSCILCACVFLCFVGVRGCGMYEKSALLSPLTTLQSRESIQQPDSLSMLIAPIAHIQIAVERRRSGSSGSRGASVSASARREEDNKHLTLKGETQAFRIYATLPYTQAGSRCRWKCVVVSASFSAIFRECTIAFVFDRLRRPRHRQRPIEAELLEAASTVRQSCR